ncbi:RHS domain-containing protein [Polaromonas sp.]|uniref:RHS domain-containing protein n=1 Tax=Polaromonas sp. TaxID=1869339 RepID=UPI00352AC494
MNRQTAPTRLLGSMQAQPQEQEKEQHARIAIHHYHCDHLGTPMALTDRPGGMGREAGPMGQCAAGIQPSRHPPGDPAAGAAP